MNIQVSHGGLLVDETALTIGVDVRSSLLYDKPSSRRTESMHEQPGSAGYQASMQTKSDEVLITLFQSGDASVFRTLVQRYQEKIRNLLYSIFRDPDVVEDLAQEVFIKAYQGLANFRYESSFYTWLYRIAVNKGRDELRKRKIRRFFSFQRLDEGIAEELEARIAVDPVNRDDEELVAMGLKMLPEKFRTAVVLKDIDGLSYEEIADVMQCEIGTVKSRLSRARTMLRKKLKPLLEEV